MPMVLGDVERWLNLDTTLDGLAGKQGKRIVIEVKVQKIETVSPLANLLEALLSASPILELQWCLR
jgi:hypothetical protein